MYISIVLRPKTNIVYSLWALTHACTFTCIQSYKQQIPPWDTCFHISYICWGNTAKVVPCCLIHVQCGTDMAIMPSREFFKYITEHVEWVRTVHHISVAGMAEEQIE